MREVKEKGRGKMREGGREKRSGGERRRERQLYLLITLRTSKILIVI